MFVRQVRIHGLRQSMLPGVLGLADIDVFADATAGFAATAL
jgi:hypothetical protein